MSDTPKEPSADEVFRHAGRRELEAADVALREAEGHLGPMPPPWSTEDKEESALRQATEALRRAIDILKSADGGAKDG